MVALFAQVRAAFQGRIFDIDRPAADKWGRIAAIRAVPVIDALLKRFQKKLVAA
jgi:hypothetical protein